MVLTGTCRLEGHREQDPLDEAPYHQWTLPGGRPWTAFYRRGRGFLLRFPDLADFQVSEDGGETICSPVPNISEELCQHLYLNQVLPLMLSRQGKLVFHASAIAASEGALAFLAESGRGKSTLAAAFAAAGYQFLTDDGMVLEEEPDGIQVLPSHPSIRLREDSRQALLGSHPGSARGIEYAGKTRLSAQQHMPHCGRRLPLRAAYFLGTGTAATITFRRLSGAEALLEWIRHAFILDVDDKSRLAAHFGKVARLFEAVPCYHLDYPRRYEDLDAVRQSIVANASARPKS